jgi:hypothetical protein
MKLCILKAVRPDRLTKAVRDYIQHEMDSVYLESPIFDIE